MLTADFNPQSTTCLICGSDHLRSYKADASDAIVPSSVTIVECEDCIFAWQYPRGRTEQQSVEFFEAAYADRGVEQSDYFNPERKRAISNLEFEFLSSLPVANHTLLDIGAGAGIFAELAAENGWYVTAIDPALDSAQMKDDPLLKKIKGTADQIPDGDLFDVITMWDVIEHSPTPLNLVDTAERHLKDGGWLIIETGNYKSGNRLRGGLHHWMYQLDHRYYFSPESMQQILMNAGLSEFIFCDRVLRPGWNGKVEYGESDWSHMLHSLAEDDHKVSDSDFNSSFISKVKSWKKAGLAIFTIAARKL